MACFMKTPPIRSLIFLFYIMSSAEAGDDPERVFISAQSDEPVTLHCKLLKQKSDNTQVWYKQIPGQELKEVATQLKDKTKGSLSTGFDKSGFNLDSDFSLTIERPTKTDEGMYFCGRSDGNTVSFSNGTFVAVKDHSQSDISVLQSPAFQSLSPGEAVNLQCTVQPNIQSVDQQVFWFRSAAGRSFPEIIYTHHNSISSSRQCEISSTKDGCVFNFTKNFFNSTDTGTYYCAVASCGRIIFGNGTPVDFKKPVDPVMLCLGAALGVCVVVIFAQAILIYKIRNGIHCGGKNQQSTAEEKPTNQTHDDAAALNYASVQFKDKKPRSDRMKKEPPEDIIYSHVRSSAAAQRSHR